MPLLNAAIVVFVIAISAAIFGFNEFATNAIYASTLLVALFIAYTLFKFFRLKLIGRR